MAARGKPVPARRGAERDVDLDGQPGRPGRCSAAAYWPGAKYVDWVGINGYLYFPQQTFAGSYVPTIAALRRFANRPILISEAAVGQLADKASKIPGLFSVIRPHRLLGFVWFDEAQHAGPYHQGLAAGGSSYQHSENHTPKLARTLTAPGSAAVGPTRYGDRLLAAPIPTLWEPRRRAQTLQGRVAERAIGHQMARYVLADNRSMAVTVSGLMDNRGAWSLIGDPPLWSRHVALRLVLRAYSLAALLSQLTCPIPNSSTVTRSIGSAGGTSPSTGCRPTTSASSTPTSSA